MNRITSGWKLVLALGDGSGLVYILRWYWVVERDFLKQPSLDLATRSLKEQTNFGKFS